MRPLSWLDPEDREPRRHPLERPPWVRLQNGRAPLGGDALQAYLYPQRMLREQAGIADPAVLRRRREG